TFNGEIYNFQSLRDELERHGARFRTRSDTEVLVEAFRRWGERCPEKLSGMFAFAIWDADHRRLFCAPDRAGEQPFYYAMVAGAFVFGSEVKAVAAHPRFSRKIHYPAVADYLGLGFVPDPKSIWEGCLKLAPGHFLWVDMPAECDPVAGTPGCYWDLE